MPSVHILTKTKTLMMLPVELIKMMNILMIRKKKTPVELVKMVDILMIKREGTDSDDGHLVDKKGRN